MSNTYIRSLSQARTSVRENEILAAVLCVSNVRGQPVAINARVRAVVGKKDKAEHMFTTEGDITEKDFRQMGRTDWL